MRSFGLPCCTVLCKVSLLGAWIKRRKLVDGARKIRSEKLCFFYFFFFPVFFFYECIKYPGWARGFTLRLDCLWKCTRKLSWAVLGLLIAIP